MRIPTYFVLLTAIALASPCAAQTASNTTAASTYRIFGVVVDYLSNQPISGARVFITPVTERNSVRSAISGSNGSFLFDRLSRGKYSLGAEYHGYPIQGYDQHEGYATAIAVGLDLDSEHIVFRLRPGSSIRGTISNDENEPVEAATVRLFASSVINGRLVTREEQSRSTDDRGYYSFAHLREGDYYIAVSGHPWYAVDTTMFRQMEELRAQTLGTRPDPEELARLERESLPLNLVYPLTFYPGSQSPEEAQPIHVKPGETVTADLLLRAVRPVHIRVPGQPQPEASETGLIEGRGAMTINTGSPPQVRVTQMVFGEPLDVGAGMSGTPRTGEFELTGIAPGHYSLIITQPGKDESTSRTQDVDLSGDIELPAFGGVSSTNVTGVVTSDARPHEQLGVRLSSKEHRRSYSGPIADGKFRISQPVPPGTYEIGIRSDSEELYLKSVSATGAKAKGRSLQIIANQPVQISLTLGRGMARVNGVALKAGKPFAGAMILLVPSDFEDNSLLLRRDQSDSDGTFTLGPVVPGKYRVIAIQDGWNISWADPKTLLPYLKDVQEVDVTGTAPLEVKVDIQSMKQ
jgi:hypothetical protein